jgi:hypothetical protein
MENKLNNILKLKINKEIFNAIAVLFYSRSLARSKIHQLFFHFANVGCVHVYMIILFC